MLDALKQYPIWTIISDGDLNNSYNAEESMEEMMRQCEKLLGFKPFVILIDIASRYYSTISNFVGVDNMIHINNNINMIETFLTDFKDLDSFDVFMPLESIYRSNRYELIRHYTI